MQRHSLEQSNQLSLFASTEEILEPSPPDIKAYRDSDPLMRPAWQIYGTPEPERIDELKLPNEVENRRGVRCESTLVTKIAGEHIVLRWDFHSTFPVPLETAIENGKLEESDLEPENLASLHDEFSRHCLALLSDIDHVNDARVAGVDPRTGKPPRTEKKRAEVQRIYAEEPPLFLRGMDVMMDVYGEAFGDEAALAFKQAITAWHAGVEVVGETATPKYDLITANSPSVGLDGLPIARPLRHSVAAGEFGVDGEPPRYIDPSNEEVIELTERLAFDLGEILLAKDSQGVNGNASAADLERQYQLQLNKYCETFGGDAAARLDIYVRCSTSTGE